MSLPPLGSCCSVAGKPQLSRCAVRFAGTATFAGGDWVGLELQRGVAAEGHGRNDGTVRGVKYFDLVPGGWGEGSNPESKDSGLFVRPGVIEAVVPGEADEIRKRFASAAAATSAAAQPSGLDDLGLDFLPGARASAPTPAPTPAPATAAVVAPPVQIAPEATKPVPSAIPTPSRDPVVAASPVAPTTNTVATPVVQPEPVAKVAAPTATPPSVSAFQPPVVSAQVATSAGKVEDVDVASAALRAQQVERLLTTVAELEAQKRSAAEQARALQQRVRELTSALDSAQEAQRAATRIAESVGAKERESLSRDNDKLRKQLDKAASDHAEAVARLKEDLEMLTVDKELAEEQCEELKVQISDLEHQLEMAEIKAIQHSVVTPGDDSASAADLRVQNERLTEALMKLRDLSVQEKATTDTEIKALRQEAAKLAALEERILSQEVELDEVKADNEELQELVDEAAGNETMIESLTRENLRLGDKTRELQVAVEELEALRDMSEELEESLHAAERRMKSELYAKEVQLLDAQSTIRSLEASSAKAAQALQRYSEANATLRSQLKEAMETATTLRGDVDEVATDRQRLAAAAVSAQQAATTVAAAKLDLRLASLMKTQATSVAQWAETVFPVSSTFANETAAAQLLLLLQRILSKSQAALDMLLTANPSAVLPSELRSGGMEESVDRHALVNAACPLIRSLKMLSAAATSLFGSGFVGPASSGKAGDLSQLKAIYEDLKPLEQGSVDALLNSLREIADSSSDGRVNAIMLAAASKAGTASRRSIDDVSRRLLHFADQQESTLSDLPEDSPYRTQRRVHVLSVRAQACTDGFERLLGEWSRHGLEIDASLRVSNSKPSSVSVNTRIRRIISRLSQIAERIEIHHVLPRAEADEGMRRSLDELSEASVKLFTALRAVNERMDGTVAQAAANLVGGSAASAMSMLWIAALKESKVPVQDGDVNAPIDWIGLPLDGLLERCGSLYSDHLAPGVGVDPSNLFVALGDSLSSNTPSQNQRLAVAAEACRAQLASSASALQRLREKDLQLEAVAQESRDRADALQQAKWDQNKLSIQVKDANRELRAAQEALQEERAKHARDKGAYEEAIALLQAESSQAAVLHIQPSPVALVSHPTTEFVAPSVSSSVLFQVVKAAEEARAARDAELGRLALQQQLPPLRTRSQGRAKTGASGALRRVTVLPVLQASKDYLEARHKWRLEACSLIDFSDQEAAARDFEAREEVGNRLDAKSKMVSSDLRRTLASEAYGNASTVDSKLGAKFEDSHAHRTLDAATTARPFARLTVEGSSSAGPIPANLTLRDLGNLAAALVN